MMKKLRIIINQNCNYDCFFCHKEHITFDCTQKTLSPDDYGFFAKVAKKCGYDHATISGGEPTLCTNLNEITNNFIKNNIELKLTTNAYYLEKINLKNFNCFNISLHSINESIYNTVTKTKKTLQHVLKNMENLICRENIKINMVALKNLTATKENIEELLTYCNQNNFKLKIIEYNNLYSTYYVSSNEIIKILKELNFDVFEKHKNNIILIKDNQKVILQQCMCSFARNQHNTCDFCKLNNDLFVLPNGNIQYCREGKNIIDAFDAIKLKDEVLLESILNKAQNLIGEHCKK